MTGKLYEGGFSGCLGYLLKRAILLGAKLAGFKGFCLFLATALLCLGRIGEDVWLTLAVTLVCSASGIRVLDSIRDGAGVLDAKDALSGRLAGRAGGGGTYGGKGGKYEAFWKDAADDVAGGPAPALPGPAGGPSAAGGGSGASGAAVRAAGRRADKADRKARGGLGDRGRERIRGILEEASRCIE